LNSKPFPGFPTKSYFTPIPNVFFSHLLQKIDNLNELKTILHIFWLLYQKKGYPRFVTYNELLADQTLINGISGITLAETLHESLSLAVEEGVLVHLALNHKGTTEEIYLVNSEVNREVISKVRDGDISIDNAIPLCEPAVKQTKPDIFTLYEQNIGMLTPMIADELKEAEVLYPDSWIEDAFKEAIDLNKRNWRYISRILERWAQEDRTDGESGRHIKKGISSEDYFKGKYGHLVRR